MGKYFSFHLATICTILAITGCVPVPINTVPLHFRDDPPVVVESTPLEDGSYALPAFDCTGKRLAVYDSSSDSVKLLRSSDLSLLTEIRPKNRPAQLYFSPRDNFLIIHTLLKSSAYRAPNFMAWEFQRVEVWDLKNNQIILNTGCTGEPYVLNSHFSADEAKFSILCADGMRHRWQTTSWQPTDNLPRPPFWGELLAANEADKNLYTKARSLPDGRFIALKFFPVRTGYSSNESYITRWNCTTNLAGEIPFGCRYGQFYGCCDDEELPFQSLSADGNRIAVICKPGLGYSVRVWDYSSGKEVPLDDARIGFFSGPESQPHVEGVALSPDGRYLAVAVPNLTKALVVTILWEGIPLHRSDLRLYSLEKNREIIAIPVEKLQFNRIDITFSADSSLLAVAGKRLRIYRLNDLVTKPD